MTQPNETEEGKGQEAAIRSPEPAAVIRAVSIEFSEAIPHPQLLSQYNEILPGGAGRIVNLAEDQVHHRQAIEARAQIFTFALTGIALVGGIVLISLGKGTRGLVPLVIAVASLGGLFVYREVRSHPKKAQG